MTKTPWFYSPYRWHWGTLGMIASQYWYCLTNGVKNIYRYTRVIWHQQDWDWNGLAQLMEIRLRDMAEYHSKHGHHLNKNKDIRQMTVCAELLKRLLADDYYDNAKSGVRFAQGRAAYEHGDKVAKNDSAYLGLILGKYLRHWWD